MKKLAILPILVIVLLTASCQYITGEAPAQTPTPAPPPITSPPPPRTDWEPGPLPPVGIGGWEQPRKLTEEERAEAIEIALNSPGASEWLQGRSDYRTGPVDWYAIIWSSNGEAGTWWSLEYDRVANEGIPDFVNPYAYWYPGVTIAVGEGTIYQMQIAVDLDYGTVVMAMGPYPSLSSPDRFKLPPPKADIEVEPEPGSYLGAPDDEPSEIVLKDVQIREELCDKDYSSPWFPAVKKGEPCLVVSGHIQNRDKEKFHIGMSALGYDEAGEVVSGTLDAAHISGAIGLYLEYEETGEFTMHLNISDNISTIRIFAQSAPVSLP